MQIQNAKNMHSIYVLKGFVFSSSDRCLLLRIFFRILEFVVISTFFRIISLHYVLSLHYVAGRSKVLVLLPWFILSVLCVDIVFFLLLWIISHLLVFSMGRLNHCTRCIVVFSDQRDTLTYRVVVVRGVVTSSRTVVHSSLKNAT